MTNQPRYRIVQEVMGDGTVRWLPECSYVGPSSYDTAPGVYTGMLFDDADRKKEWKSLAMFGACGAYPAQCSTYDEARDMVERSYLRWLETQVVATAIKEIPGEEMPEFPVRAFERRPPARDPLIFGAP